MRRELTTHQKNLVLRELDAQALRLAQDQLDPNGQLPPTGCLVVFFLGGRYDGDVERRIHEGEPPEDLYLPAARSLTLESQDDPGAFPDTLEILRYECVGWARYDVARDAGAWRNYAAAYRLVEE